MSSNFRENAAGGIRFSTPAFSFGTTTPAINSGLSFDLPMASIQDMSNNALTFTQNNAIANRGFLGNVISNTSAGVSSAVSQSVGYQKAGLSTMQNIGFSISNMFKTVAKYNFDAKTSRQNWRF